MQLRVCCSEPPERFAGAFVGDVVVREPDGVFAPLGFLAELSLMGVGQLEPDWEESDLLADGFDGTEDCIVDAVGLDPPAERELNGIGLAEGDHVELSSHAAVQIVDADAICHFQFRYLEHPMTAGLALM